MDARIGLPLGQWSPRSRPSSSRPPATPAARPAGGAGSAPVPPSARRAGRAIARGTRPVTTFPAISTGRKRRDRPPRTYPACNPSRASAAAPPRHARHARAPRRRWRRSGCAWGDEGVEPLSPPPSGGGLGGGPGLKQH
jgi:hypothetical protein